MNKIIYYDVSNVEDIADIAQRHNAIWYGGQDTSSFDPWEIEFLPRNRKINIFIEDNRMSWSGKNEQVFGDIKAIQYNRVERKLEQFLEILE